MNVGRTCAKCQAVNGHTYSHCAGCGEPLPPVFPQPSNNNGKRNRVVALSAVVLVCLVFLIGEFASIADRQKALAAEAKAERDEAIAAQRERELRAAIAQAQADAVKRQREELATAKLPSVDDVTERERVKTHSEPKPNQ